MCMEDIRIGRKSQCSVRSVAVSNAAPTTIAPANPNRIRLFVSANDSQSLRIGPLEVPPSGTVGIGLEQGGSSILLKIEEVGSILQKPWQAQAALANTTVVVIDVSLPDQ